MRGFTTEGRLLRLPEVLGLVPIRRSTLYRWVQEGKFPPPVRLGERAIAWKEVDVLAWQARLPKGVHPPVEYLRKSRKSAKA
jgi:prophage regulatory protein